ncbi:hypothetical protein C7S20_05295 [Christiangramia fulva]|uniref:Uncharacterized protein n=1 Tax=Christiangramia fulva TaxID=2126553 RepID=A0A2R3Z385_9FLAO|nr:hypothetical protein [Christiangramia fulva]AVR44726.1 hypothetical protein C7S20_05295 [Christiangramia fulva]
MEISKNPVSAGHDKSSNYFVLNQNSEVLFRSLANVETVRKELKFELSVINNIILKAKKEVDSKMEEDPYLFMESRFYSSYFNSRIKGNLRQFIVNNPEFRRRIKIRVKYGSAYFIVKDRYLIYIKKLNGNGKPNYVSTPRSNKLMNGLPFRGGDSSIPILFVGPQFRGIHFEGTSITSLISKKEVNWNMSISDLFSGVNYNLSSDNKIITTELDNVRIKNKSLKNKRKSS